MFGRPHIIPQPRSYYVYSENLLPEVWFDAAKVWEVKAADLSISPVHRAAVGQLDPGTCPQPGPAQHSTARLRPAHACDCRVGPGGTCRLQRAR